MAAFTSTTQTPAFLKGWWTTSSDDNIRKDDQTAVRILLDKFIKDNHNVFHTAYRDQPNVLARVLVALHEMGASRDELVRGYYNASPTFIPFGLHKTHDQPLVTSDTWQTHLGDPSYYQAYLAFFSDQVTMHGIDRVVEAFFIHGPLSGSIGSRLQPFVHLTFGIEYAMPHIVAQGLAYLATTHLDVSFFVVDHDQVCGTLNPSTVLFEQIAIDPRFAGRMEATDMSSYKLLLTSQGPLLCIYMRLCACPTPEDLVRLALDLVRNPTIPLAASTQLLEAARSIDLWPVNLRPRLSQLILLAMFCTFIVEQSSTVTLNTAIKTTSTTATTAAASWEQCTDLIKAVGNPILVLLFQNLVKISKENYTPGSDLLGLMNALVINN